MNQTEQVAKWLYRWRHHKDYDPDGGDARGWELCLESADELLALMPGEPVGYVDPENLPILGQEREISLWGTKGWHYVPLYPSAPQSLDQKFTIEHLRERMADYQEEIVNLCRELDGKDALLKAAPQSREREALEKLKVEKGKLEYVADPYDGHRYGWRYGVLGSTDGMICDDPADAILKGG